MSKSDRTQQKTGFSRPDVRGKLGMRTKWPDKSEFLDPSPTKPDVINHPEHYTSHPSGIECIDVIEHLPFCIGAAIKYLWRCGLKGSDIEDLRKAEWYVRREIARREKLNNKSQQEKAS